MHKQKATSRKQKRVICTLIYFFTFVVLTRVQGHAGLLKNNAVGKAKGNNIVRNQSMLL